jgi:uncharacterized protein
MMSTDISRAKVQRLELEHDGETSYLAYEIDPKGWLVLWHTEVPKDQRGQGLAAQLVHKAFDYAEANRLKVELVCPFAMNYVAHHPELQRLVEKRPNGVR